jgi:hypothetical protein
MDKFPVRRKGPFVAYNEAAADDADDMNNLYLMSRFAGILHK